MEKFLREVEQRLPRAPRPLPTGLFRRLLDAFDPAQGFWIAFLSFPMALLLPIGLLTIGIRFGPVAFYSVLAAVASLGTYVLEKKYGAHLQVEEFSLAKRTLAVVPAFLLATGIFLLMFHLAGRI